MNQFLNDPLAYQQQVAQQQAMMETPSTPNFFKLPDMVGEPQVSNNMMTTGLMMLASSLKGEDTGSVIANGLQTYAQSVEGDRQRQRQERADRLAEYDLLGRIRERQITELQAVKKTQMLDRLKAKNPEMADLIELDPESAAKVISERFKPKTPFEGTGMDAQIANVLLQGDPSTPEYLAAYNMASQPKVSIGADGTPITITPNMSAYRTPTSQGASYGTTGGVTLGQPTASTIEGYDIAEGARPSSQDAKAVKDIQEAYNNISPLLQERERLINKSPAPALGSAEAIALEQNSNQIALKLKTLEQTGALDKGSVDVIMKVVGDPVNRGIDPLNPISSAREAYTRWKKGGNLTKPQLESAKSYIDETLNSAVKARGYKKHGMLADDTPKDKGVLSNDVSVNGDILSTLTQAQLKKLYEELKAKKRGDNAKF